MHRTHSSADVFSISDSNFDLQKAYTEIIAFIESDCTYLLVSDPNVSTVSPVKSGKSKAEEDAEGPDEIKATTNVDHSLPASLKDFDFLTRSIFPSIHDKIYQKNPNIFSPAVPESFYKNYVISMQFLDSLEKFFATQDDPIVSNLPFAVTYLYRDE